MEGSQLLKYSFGALNIAFWGYILAWLAHAWDACREDRKIERPAILLGWIAFGFHSLALVLRWQRGGFFHPPWTTLYEVLIFFSWSLMASRIYLAYRFRFRWGGFFMILLTILALVLARLNPNRGVELLQPALQSKWLLVHVSVAVAAYAFFLLSASFSFFYLAKDRVKTDVFQLGSSGLGLLVAAILIGYDYALTGGIDLRWLPGPSTGSLLGFGMGAWLVHWTIGSFSNTLLVPVTLGKSQGSAAGFLGEPGERLDWLQLGLRLTFALGAFSLLCFCVSMVWLNGHAGDFRLGSAPYRFASLLGVTVIGIFFLGLSHWRGILEGKLPSPVRLDRLSYQCTLVAFGMMTLTLVTGAAWAYQAWGRYWGWDPKEVWALVTWLFYAIYLHNRLTSRWTGRQSAFLSIAGTAVVLFTFLGVNILIVGIHAFATR